MRKTRVLLVDVPCFVRNADLRSVDVSADLIRSIGFWPENSGLQIDMFSTNKRVYITLKLLGEYFDEWVSEVRNTVGAIARIEPMKLDEYNELISGVTKGLLSKDGEVFELLPYGETQTLSPDDFEIDDSDESDQNHVMMIVENITKDAITVPNPRVINTAILLDYLHSNQGSLIRTVLSPANEINARDVREDLFNSDPGLIRRTGYNAEIINARCFVSNTKKVPISLKRALTDMSADSTLYQLDQKDIEYVFKNPLYELEKYARLALTAASWVRIPALDASELPKIKKDIDGGKKSTNDANLNQIDTKALEETIEKTFEKSIERILNEFEKDVDEKLEKHRDLVLENVGQVLNTAQLSFKTLLDDYFDPQISKTINQKFDDRTLELWEIWESKKQEITTAIKDNADSELSEISDQIPELETELLRGFRNWQKKSEINSEQSDSSKPA